MLTKCLFFFLSDSHKIKSVLKERRQRHDKEDEHRYSFSKLSVDILVMHILLLANFLFCKVGQSTLSIRRVYFEILLRHACCPFFLIFLSKRVYTSSFRDSVVPFAVCERKRKKKNTRDEWSFIESDDW